MYEFQVKHMVNGIYLKSIIFWFEYYKLSQISDNVTFFTCSQSVGFRSINVMSCSLDVNN